MQFFSIIHHIFGIKGYEQLHANLLIIIFFSYNMFGMYQIAHILKRKGYVL